MGDGSRRIPEVHCTASPAFLVKIQANETPCVKQKKCEDPKEQHLKLSSDFQLHTCE